MTSMRNPSALAFHYTFHRFDQLGNGIAFSF